MGYPVGRIVFELMRTDEAHVILGQRVNVWTSLFVFLLGLGIVWANRRRPVALATREPEVTSQHTE
jgi:prolipoprotein diacylglyceryltransferase